MVSPRGNYIEVTISMCNMRMLAILLATIVPATISSTDALAHRFTVALVAPISGTDSDVGRQARDGFRLATTERDGHSNEESDGHLGGLDVYILEIDANQVASALLQEIELLVEREQVEIVASLAAPTLNQDLRRQLTGTNAVLIEASETVSPETTTMDGEAFATVFEKMFSQTPAGPAYRGYGVARLIDQIVRAIEGDFSDLDNVRSAVARVGDQ